MPTMLHFDVETLKELSFQLINTFIICVALGWFLYKPVKEFLRKRSERIANQLLEAENAVKESQRNRSTYEQKLAEIDQERSDILEKARKIAIEKENAIIENARREASVILNRARLEIEREQDKAKSEVKTQMIEIASLIAKKYVQASIDLALQDRLIDEAIQDLGDASWL